MSAQPPAAAPSEALLERWLSWLARDEGQHLLGYLGEQAQQDAAEHGSRPIVIAIPPSAALELAALDPELAVDVQQCTGGRAHACQGRSREADATRSRPPASAPPRADAYRVATAAVLVAQGLVGPQARVWIRFEAAWVHHASVDALGAAAVAHGPHTASFTGIVQALSTRMHCVYSRSFM